MRLPTKSSVLCAATVVGLMVISSRWMVAADEPAAKSTPAADKAPRRATAPPKHVTRSLRGRVVWMAEALKRRYGIESDADAAQTQAAIETTDGELYPIVKDGRGRGFWLDPRLRGIDMELMVRQFEHSPAVQIVRVHTMKEGRKYELDYWCDICAIPMYELKDCECCQGPVRLRERDVEKSPE